MFKIEKLPYPILLGLHFGIGLILSISTSFAKPLVIIVMLYLLFRVFKSLDRNSEILLACFYFTAFEVFFRMTRGVFFYELGKYFVLVLVIIGIFLKGFAIKSTPYVIYLLILIPSIFVAASNIDLDDSLRKAVAFSLSGPAILGVCAIYCYERKISQKRLLEIFGLVSAAVFSMTVYLILDTPDLERVITGTGSNFATSGGFGPNQVSTALGIGMFVCFARFMLNRTLINNVIDLCLFLIMAYRGYLTFSRGGVLTALFMIVAFIATVLFFNRKNFRISFIPKIVLIFTGVIVAFLYTAVVTGGLIANRYTNKNALGVEKTDVTTGRGDLASFEFETFIEHPLLGIGVGLIRPYRIKKTGHEANSHNEISRLLAEHGAVGVLSLGMLVLIPLFYRLSDRSNIFFYSFLVFWFATINHSAMRIAAPSFIYGLALLRFEQPVKKLKRKEEEEPDEFVEFMREKKLLPKKRELPQLP